MPAHRGASVNPVPGAVGGRWFTTGVRSLAEKKRSGAQGRAKVTRYKVEKKKSGAAAEIDELLSVVFAPERARWCPLDAIGAHSHCQPRGAPALQSAEGPSRAVDTARGGIWPTQSRPLDSAN